MGVSLGEAFVSLGFDVDDAKLSSFDKGIKDLTENILKTTAAAAGVVYALSAFVKGPTDSATAMRNLNRELGISTDLLQEWSIASQKTNSLATEGGVFASIKSITEKLAEVRKGAGPSGAYALLGIDPTQIKDAGQLLETLRESYRNNKGIWANDMQNRLSAMREIGFDPSMLGALDMSREQFKGLSSGLIISPEANNSLVSLGQNLKDLMLIWESFQKKISARWGNEFVENFRSMLGVINEFSLSIGAILEKLEPFKTAIIVFSAAVIAAMRPVLLLISAIAFVVEDLGRLFRGLPTMTEAGFGALMVLGLSLGHWPNPPLANACCTAASAAAPSNPKTRL